MKFLCYIIIFGWILLSNTLICYGQGPIQIDVTGNWNLTLSASDISDAGNDFSNIHTSSANELEVDVFKLGGFFGSYYLFGFNWRVDIRQDEINWHPNLQLSARRTGNGTTTGFFGLGNINGGTAFQQVSSNNTIFYSGSYGRLNVPIQLRLQGISVLLPAQTYTTTIVLTVTEL